MTSHHVPARFDLRDKVVAITGGGGVLCAAMARALAQAGAAVAALDLRAEAAARVAREITQSGGRAVGVECDVLSRPSIEAAYARVVAERCLSLATCGEIEALVREALAPSESARA